MSKEPKYLVLKHRIPLGQGDREPGDPIARMIDPAKGAQQDNLEPVGRTEPHEIRNLLANPNSYQVLGESELERQRIEAGEEVPAVAWEELSGDQRSVMVRWVARGKTGAVRQLAKALGVKAGQNEAHDALAQKVAQALQDTLATKPPETTSPAKGSAGGETSSAS